MQRLDLDFFHINNLFGEAKGACGHFPDWNVFCHENRDRNFDFRFNVIHLIVVFVVVVVSFVTVDAVVDVTVDVVGIKVVEIIANSVINVIGVALVDVDVVDVGVVDVYVSDFLVGWEPDEVVGFWFFIDRRLI